MWLLWLALAGAKVPWELPAEVSDDNGLAVACKVSQRSAHRLELTATVTHRGSGGVALLRTRSLPVRVAIDDGLAVPILGIHPRGVERRPSRPWRPRVLRPGESLQLRSHLLVEELEEGSLGWTMGPQADRWTSLACGAAYAMADTPPEELPADVTFGMVRRWDTAWSEHIVRSEPVPVRAQRTARRTD